MCSLIELLLDGITFAIMRSLRLLRIFRTLRILRIFRLTRHWKSFNTLFTVIKNTIVHLGFLFFVMCLIISIFAVVGMQVFGRIYTENACEWEGCVIPRWNFVDFVHR